jgi:hypothetical protein
MYGKIYDTIYDGTLYGHWEAIVTMQQLIVLAGPDGVVDMTPQALAARTSIPLKIIEKGLKILMAPDPHSRTEGDDGRRIALIDDHRPWGWRLVNHAKYMRLRNMDEKREADRARISAKRRKNSHVADSRNQSLLVRDVAHSDTDSDTDRSTTLFAEANGAWDEFWKAYPRKTAKQVALKAWKRVKADEISALMAALEVHKGSEQWTRGVIPHPATWLHQRRWEDETVSTLDDLGQCMWNRDGNRDLDKPRCTSRGVQEDRGIIYCSKHQHLHRAR